MLAMRNKHRDYLRVCAATRAASKFTEITPVSISRSKDRERDRERQQLRETSAKKMHGNNIQECDAHDKSNTTESPPARARLQPRDSRFASASKMVLHTDIIISDFAPERNTLSHNFNITSVPLFPLAFRNADRFSRFTFFVFQAHLSHHGSHIF